MWSCLPSELLASIFSYLPPDSLARAKAACWNWHKTAEMVLVGDKRCRHTPWFLALPTRGRCLSWCAHNPIGNNWHMLPLDHINSPIRPIATISGLVLLRVTTTTYLKLALCNPFTRQFRHLSVLNVTRTNPVVGVVEHDPSQKSWELGFKIYVAGGMSQAASGGAIYQPTIEMYEPSCNKWKIIGPMPVKFAVRLTVWTPNESVYSNGILYWMTSARAYCVMGFEIKTNKWRELSVPMADRLEFATLVPRNGNLTLVGGTNVGNLCIWELGKDDVWCMIGRVPIELGVKLVEDEPNWASIKCVGIDGAICLYRNLGSGLIVWREAFDKEKLWEWIWIEGCHSIREKQLQKLPIKGLLLQPNLAHSNFFPRWNMHQT